MKTGFMVQLRNFVLTTVWVVTILPTYAALQPGQLSAVRRQGETGERQILGFVAILHDEIKYPTDPRKGTGGGVIDHEYQLTQISKAIWHAANTAEGRSALKQALSRERDAEAVLALTVALGNCGDDSVRGDLVAIVMNEDLHHLREFATHGLLQCKAYEAIPELIQLLSDETWRYDRDTMGRDRPRFPVRNQAWIVLTHLGVTAMREYETGQYAVNTRSAVRVLRKEMVNAVGSQATALLSAIARIGGPDAKTVLREYAESEINTPEEAQVAAYAGELLSQTLDTTIEERRDRTPLPDEVLNLPRREPMNTGTVDGEN